MAGVKLRHVERFKDRHGRTRFYYRKGKGKRVPLLSQPGTREFLDEYYKAAGGYGYNAIDSNRTFHALAKLYFSSNDYINHTKPNTKISARHIIEDFVTDHGHRLVTQVKREHIETILASKADTPGTANNLLKWLKVLVNFAIRNGWEINGNPTSHIAAFKQKPHHTWNEREIAKFEERWPIGTRERTAFGLHLYTAQRRGDIRKAMWQDLSEFGLHIVQEKTEVELIIPLHSQLVLILEAWRVVSPSIKNEIIVTQKGQPYTINGYAVLLADAIERAGLPKRCVPHGLRKAALRRLADLGCSAKQMQAISGHKTLRELERYTEAANQKTLAADAIATMEKV